MKRSTCLLLCIIFLFSLVTMLAACGEDDPSTATSASSSTSASTSGEPSASLSASTSTSISDEPSGSGGTSGTPSPIDPSGVFDGSLDPNGWT